MNPGGGPVIRNPCPIATPLLAPIKHPQNYLLRPNILIRERKELQKQTGCKIPHNMCMDEQGKMQTAEISCRQVSFRTLGFRVESALGKLVNTFYDILNGDPLEGPQKPPFPQGPVVIPR